MRLDVWATAGYLLINDSLKFTEKISTRCYLDFGEFVCHIRGSRRVAYLTRPVSCFLKFSSRCKTFKIAASSSADRKLKSSWSAKSLLGFIVTCCPPVLPVALYYTGLRRFPHQEQEPTNPFLDPPLWLRVHDEHAMQQHKKSCPKTACHRNKLVITASGLGWATGLSCF